jgi:hypothetical protein
MKFDHQTRRSVLRAVLAGLLALLGVTLARRSQVCTRGGACEGCAQFARCALPQKESTVQRHSGGFGKAALPKETTGRARSPNAPPSSRGGRS